MTEPRWLSPDERETWLRVAAVLELLPSSLDAQLHRDADLTQFEYYVLAMLSEAPERRLRMSDLAAHTNATLPRLSRVVAGLERTGLVERTPCPEDRRATLAQLTAAGFARVESAAPGHVEHVRRHVIDPLSPAQLAQLRTIAGLVLETLDPEGRMLAGARLAAGLRDDEPGSPGRRGALPLPRLAAPAARALREAGFASLDSLAGARSADLIALHGVGRSALRAIRDALADARFAPLVDDRPPTDRVLADD